MPKPSASQIGRPTKCTPEATAIVCENIAKGLPKRHAYALAGISHVAALDWERRGAGGEEPFAAFATACARAMAVHVAMRMERIEAAINDLWKRDAWMLEKLDPEHFGTRRVEVTGADGGPVQVQAQIVVVPARAVSVQDWSATVRAPDAIPGPDALDKDGND
jgi:hypothetical protein